MAEETKEVQEMQPQGGNPFDESAWVENPQPAAEETQAAQAAEGAAKPNTESPAATFDPNSYLKEKFGWDNEEVALREFDELKKNRSQETQESVKFDNEYSKQFFDLLKEGKEDDVYSFLAQKKQIDRLVNAPVDNAVVAAEIVKTAMAHQYKDLSADEIDFQFNKKFAIPEKPVQGFDQDNDDYQAALAKWEQQKAEVEKGLIIEAKLNKPVLNELRQELKLPDLKPAESASNPQQEIDPAIRQQYEQALERDYSKFSGFNVVAKSGDAELPIAFVPTAEEKAQMKERLFDFDANDYLSQRWVSQNGAINIEQAIRDIYLLENRDAIFQKIANESATKMFEHTIKSRANVNLDSTGTQRTQQIVNSNPQSQQEAAIWDA